MLRTLVVAASMNKLAAMEIPAIKKHLAAFWVRSHEVAAISYVLSKSQSHLVPEQALLAGLTHNIGVLPLLLYIDQHARFANDADVEVVMRRCAAIVGERLLQLWEFPAELVAIPMAHEDLHRAAESNVASYADIVTVANLLNQGGSKIVNWDDVASVKRIGIHSNLYREFFERFGNDLNAAREILRPV
jgi:HD-like signal output (HDOD) protein